MKDHYPLRPAIYHSARFLLYFLAIGVAVASMRYWSFEVVGLLHLKTPEVLNNLLFRAAFYGHVIFGPIALMAGPFQFSPKLRQRRLSLHRTLGKIYVAACLLSGLAGLAAAQFASGGRVAQIGFSGLALAWLFTTSNAWLAIRQKKVEAHRRWMILSFSLTLAAVTLRIYLPILQGMFGLSFIESYQIVSWLCWVPNLAVAVIWLGYMD